MPAMAVHRSASLGFGRTADAYERGRPGYPPEAIEWLCARLELRPGKSVLDVGAGTGKLTRALLPSSATLIAVEPVRAMRAVLERQLPSIGVLDGTAESIPMGDGIADAVVAGQAFHWFDAPAALAEFHRVLAPRGRLGLVWNVRDRRQALQRAIDEIIEPLRAGAPGHANGRWRDALTQSSLFVPVCEHRVGYEVELDADTFVDRIASVSFIAALDDVRRQELLERVRTLAAEHPEPWAYVTEVYVYERVQDALAARAFTRAPCADRVRSGAARRTSR